MSEPLKFQYLKNTVIRVGDVLEYEEVTILPDDPRYPEFKKLDEWLRSRPTTHLSQR